MAKSEPFLKLKCFNPLKKNNHDIRDKKKLRNVTSWMCSLFPQLPKGGKICDSCRIEIGTLKNENTVGSSSTRQDKGRNSDSDEDTSFSATSEAIGPLNISLQELGESPIDTKKFKSKNYATIKVKKIDSTIKRKLFKLTDDFSEDDSEDVEESVLQNLKANFLSSTSRSKKLMILTCLPPNWGVRKIMREFGAPNYMVRQSKKLLAEKGMLESPNPKPGKTLSEEVVEAVHLFYENDEVSRVMPGVKDCVTVTEPNKNKLKVSKRLILCNLKEGYTLFKEKFPHIKIGFSKFAELRPKHCILAGSSGTHAVCVCTIHQNVKLMIENSKLGDLTNGELKTYKDCLLKMVCNPSTIDCNIGNCTYCPGNAAIQTVLEKSFEEHLIRKITFRQWISVDRCNLEVLQKSSADFIELLCDKLSLLVRHDFIAKQQTSFMNHIKENLKESEFAITLDFSENYSMVVQDEAQTYHWTKGHATVHPFVIYYKGENKIDHLNYVIISECLEHNTVAVYTFQRKLVEFLMTKFKKVPQKLFYFSDGSAAQYKNKKNFINLCFHKQDFNISAEWHFSATAHGKGPCDGVGGTVKRLAARASLQRPYDNQILTPLQLYEWAVENISGINFTFTTQEDYIESEIFLKERFNQAVTIQGTQQYHAFIPVDTSTSKITVKIFSEATHSSLATVTRSPDKHQIGDVNGYTAIVYDKKWWLAYVMEKNEEIDEVKVTFLHPAGPSPSFSYPGKPDVLWIPLTDVLCLVNPVTPTGRIYVLSENDTLKTNEAFFKHCN